jgi:hypothetical protein
MKSTPIPVPIKRREGSGVRDEGSGASKGSGVQVKKVDNLKFIGE